MLDMMMDCGSIEMFIFMYLVPTVYKQMRNLSEQLIQIKHLRAGEHQQLVLQANTFVNVINLFISLYLSPSLSLSLSLSLLC